MHHSLAFLDHRPWPLPSRRWAWRQSWCDLLFAHWPIKAERLRPLVPEGLTIQQFNGTAWIGVVPFRMNGVARWPFPPLPGISDFPELNVRTYVDLDGRPGVWFLSLDATSVLAVWGGRRFFHLPYFRARMGVVHRGDAVDYHSSRGPYHFDGSYRPTSDVYRAVTGSLEHWLTERYCLYAQDSQGTIWRTDVHHEPWPLQQAEADIRLNTMLEGRGIAGPTVPPLLHFARGVDVVAWTGECLGPAPSVRR